MALRNEKGRFRAPTPAEKIDIRQDKDLEQQKADIKHLKEMMENGHPTFILVYADWCGYCREYMPTWSKWEDTPGRSANMAKVHYDMQESVPAIKDAKIQGYPTVIKVLPNGKIQPYPSEGGVTNAVPFMREEEEMAKEIGLRQGQAGGGQAGGQAGGVLGAFAAAIQQAGPAALLLLATSAVRRARTYKAPKRVSVRASTRRSRRSRKLRRA